MAYQRWWKTIRDQQGNAINGASVSVYYGGTGTLALVYDPNSDDSSPSDLPNPFTTTANGVFGFMAVDGEYDVVIEGGNLATQQFRVTLNGFISGSAASLAADLAAPTGAGLVGTRGLLTSEVASTLAQRDSEWYSVFRWFTSAQIADWTARTALVDCTDAIQAALNAIPLSATLYFPPGCGLVSDPHANGYCLLVSRPCKLMGSGSLYSAIQPNASLGSTVDVLRISPSISYAVDLLTIDGLYWGNPNNGTCAGRDGIRITTANTGQYLPKFTLRNCSFGTSSNGVSFSHYHTSPDAQGGVWTALIENNQFRSGVYFSGTGDSNVLRGNSIAGSNIGVYLSQVSGASCFSIEENNITATGGAIKIDLASRVSIRHNNIEIPSGAGSNSAIIDFNGLNGVSYGGEIRNNLISGFGTTTATTGIRIKNANGLHIEDNVFLSGISTFTTAINVVDGSAQNVKVGHNTYNSGFTPAAYAAGTTYAAGAYVRYNEMNWVSLSAGNIGNTPGLVQTFWQLTEGPKILDAGAGTCGVIKPITLGASWVPYGAAFSQPYFYKDTSGVVHLHGLIKTGTTTPGTTIFTLPTGFRPDHITYHIVHSNSGAVAGVGSINCYDTTNGGGIVTINTGGNTMFSFDGVSFVASGKADGVSAE